MVGSFVDFIYSLWRIAAHNEKSHRLSNLSLLKQEAGYETVARVDRNFYEDVATNANNSEGTPAEGQ
jgi:hypothetical protein